MAYIGRQLARGENRLFDDISGSFNGSTTTFNLTISSVATSTATPFQLFVSLGGVMQKPNTDFTTAGNQITFTTAPAAGLSCWIMMQGDTVDQAAIPDASVTPSKIAGSGDFAFPADVRLKDADGSHYLGFQAPSTVSNNVVWTLPATDTSVSGYVLSSDGSGNLSWVEAGDSSSPSFTGDVTLTNDGALVGTSSFNATYTGSVKTFTVTVASKSAAHRYNGSGSGSGYKINGKESPFLTLTPGRTYKFDQSDGSNSGHPLRFYLEANKTTAYTTGVTTNGTAGSSGAYTQIVVSDTTPQVLHYQCSAHSLMGNSVQTNSNVAAAGSLNGATLASGVTASSLTSVGTLGSLAVTNNVTVGGNLTVSGTTTTVDSVTLSVKDKNIEMGVVSSPSDTTADGGGITLKGASDHTFNWINATDAWTSSEHIHLLDNKKLFVGGASGTTDGLEIVHNASDSILNDTGTGTLKLQLGGSTKLEITSGGIDVTGAISVGGSPLSTAPTITATANGSISANAAVIVEADGKVAAISGYSFAQGSDTHQFAGNPSGSTRELAIASDSTNNQTVAVYDDSGLKCIVATYSGTTPTLNTATSINTSGNSPSHMAICNISSGVYIVAYAAGSDAYARVLTVSGSGSSATVAVGTDLDFSIGSGTFLYPQLETLKNQTNRALLLYVDDNAGDSGARVLTISNTGANATIATTSKDVWLSAEATYLRTDWDNDNNVVVAFYRHSAQTSGYATLFSVSGTTITDGADQGSLAFGLNGSTGCYDSVNNIYVQFGINGGNNYVYYKTGTFSSGNNYISWTGSTTSMAGNTTSSIDDSLRAVFDEFSGNIILMYAKSDTMYMQYGKYSSGSISWNTEVEVTGGINSNGDTSIAVLNQGRVPIIRKLTSNTGAGKLKALQFPGTTLTTENFIGFASTGYSNGNTATINVTGNTTTQSSLTPGQKYFIQNDGSLALTAADPSVAAGRALTSTKLLINTGD